MGMFGGKKGGGGGGIGAYISSADVEVIEIRV